MLTSCQPNCNNQQVTFINFFHGVLSDIFVRMNNSSFFLCYIFWFLAFNSKMISPILKLVWQILPVKSCYKLSDTDTCSQSNSTHTILQFMSYAFSALKHKKHLNRDEKLYIFRFVDRNVKSRIWLNARIKKVLIKII